MAVGRPLDTSCPDYTLELCTEDTTSGDILQVLSSSTVTQANITPGTFYDLTTSYDAPASGGPIGQMLALDIICSNFYETNGVGTVGVFDNARLTVSAPVVGTPAAPSGLTATAASASEIDLSWTNNAANQTGFKIDQATSSDFTQGLTTATVGANATTYSATGLSSNTTYYYRVRATNANGDSANTSTASATTQGAIPAAPSGLTAAAASWSQINLSWTNNAVNQTGFQIDQATSSDFTQGLTTATVGAAATTYSATGLSAGATYYYRVRATNAVGDSANTSTASATTAAAGVPVAVPVPDGDFSADAAANYMNSNTGGGLTFTAPMTATLSGWNVSATPSTANGGFYSAWEPYGVLNTVASGSGATPYNSNVAWIGNQPASNL